MLDAGEVRDSDIKHLTSLTGLEHLRLRESPLSDDGLQELAGGQVRSLLILNLPQAKPTAVGLKALASLPKLRQLRIAGRQIDDAAVEELAHWPALSSLHLIQPGITGKSLETIATMSELSSLYIDECALPDEAWAKLFTARPSLHVHVDQAPSRLRSACALKYFANRRFWSQHHRIERYFCHPIFLSDLGRQKIELTKK